MVQFEEGWEFINHEQFDLFGEDDRLPESGSDGYSALGSDSDSDFPDPVVRIRETPRKTTPVLGFPANVKRREDATVEEIVREHVLPFLPAKSLSQFRSVSGDWNKWITGPFLAHKQSNCFRSFSGLFYQTSLGFHSFLSLEPAHHGVPSPSLAFLPEPAIVRSSSNGLICCQADGWDSSPFYVCNPVTRQYHELPPPEHDHGCFEQSAAVLAFDPTVLNFSADYDLICPVPFPDSEVIQFEIYSSSAKAWTMSEAVVCGEGPGVMDLRGGGFYMNGVAYWKTGWSEEVLALDVRNGHYGIFPLPSTPPGVLAGMQGGELAYVSAHRVQDDENGAAASSYEVEIYGVQDSTLRQRIHLSPEVVGAAEGGEFRVLPCINTEEVLVMLAGKRVISYHVREGRVVELGNGEDLVDADFWPYVNSLVHLPHG